ncbi:hypothetical protein CLOM_g12778, partial [Closterium sp. NIES-68]
CPPLNAAPSRMVALCESEGWGLSKVQQHPGKMTSAEMEDDGVVEVLSDDSSQDQMSDGERLPVGLKVEVSKPGAAAGGGFARVMAPGGGGGREDGWRVVRYQELITDDLTEPLVEAVPLAAFFSPGFPRQPPPPESRGRR